MSARIEGNLPLETARPTPAGPRRRPPVRGGEVRRPGQVYRVAIERCLANMIVMDRTREERASS